MGAVLGGSIWGKLGGSMGGLLGSSIGGARRQHGGRSRRQHSGEVTQQPGVLHLGNTLWGNKLRKGYPRVSEAVREATATAMYKVTFRCRLLIEGRLRA